MIGTSLNGDLIRGGSASGLLFGHGDPIKLIQTPTYSSLTHFWGLRISKFRIELGRFDASRETCSASDRLLLVLTRFIVTADEEFEDLCF